MSDQPRPVWLNRAQRDEIDIQGFEPEIVAAWDAAPADPTGEVEVAIFAYDFPLAKRPWTAQEREEYAARAALVLRALGMPDE